MRFLFYTKSRFRYFRQHMELSGKKSQMHVLIPIRIRGNHEDPIDPDPYPDTGGKCKNLNFEKKFTQVSAS